MAEPSFKDLAYRALAGAIGGPVDITTMLMRPFGYNVPSENVFGSSEYLGRQMEQGGLVSEARNPTQEFLASMAVPMPSTTALKGAGMIPELLAGMVGVGMARGTGAMPSNVTGVAQPSPAPTFNLNREEFLGNPKIVSNRYSSDLVPRQLSTQENLPRQPFLGGKFESKLNEDGIVVFDGDKLVGEYNFGDKLVVDPKYRRQGIAEEMVYQFRTNFPEPAKAKTRTKASQEIQEKVFDRIQSERQINTSGTAVDDFDYRGVHRAPDARVYGATIDNLQGIMPADVYTNTGKNLYGLGDSVVDREWFAAAMKAKGNPNAEIEVYRAVPKGVKTINNGDFVTTSKKYAEMHGENVLDEGFEIIKKKVPARFLSSEGYPYEFGYNDLDEMTGAIRKGLLE